MANTIQENFNNTLNLEAESSSRIQAMITCLEETTNTRIDLIEPEYPSGTTILFTLVPGGNLVDLQNCCDLKNVTLSEGTLTARDW